MLIPYKILMSQSYKNVDENINRILMSIKIIENFIKIKYKKYM